MVSLRLCRLGAIRNPDMLPTGIRSRGWRDQKSL